MDKRKIFLDFDSTICNSIKQICKKYNENYTNHPKFKPARWQFVEKWDFADECPLAGKTVITSYFNEAYFHNGIEFMKNAEEVINILSTKFDIYVPSLGYTNNLLGKEKWLKENLPCIKEFIPCHFDEYKDKAHLDMTGSIIVDDCASNLITSNADIKICYGDLYDWNKSWDGKRCWNYYELKEFLMD